MRIAIALKPTLVLMLELALTLTVLSSCSAPPKPAEVQESRKRPINTANAIELQTCKNELQNMRLQASSTAREAEMANSKLNRLTALTERLQLLTSLQQTPTAQATTQPAAKAMPGNSVYVVPFAYGSSHLNLPSDATSAWVDEAKAAPLVMLRGRTDGAKDSAADSRLARDRAAAVKDYLVTQGVEPSRIRSTYQPGGDPMVGKANAGSRALKRRVEIEIYRSLPVEMSLGHSRTEG